MNKKIFIDCGAHKATTAKRVINRHPNYELHCFESNPRFFRYFKGLDLKLHKKAVWIHNKSITYYPAENSYSGSLYKEKVTGNIQKEKPLIVDCIDFSQWLLDNFNRDDYIILKFNIEGSEYEILRKMIKDGSISLIDELYCQFHYEKIPSISRRAHNKLLKRIKKYNLSFYLWIDEHKIDFRLKPKRAKSKLENKTREILNKLLRLNIFQKINLINFYRKFIMEKFE